METGILLSFGIINIIILNLLDNETKWLNILNTIVYIISSVASILVEADKYNKIVVLGFLMFKMISIVWGIIVGVVIIATPDYFINCTSDNKYECTCTKSVLPEFVGALYIGSSFVSIYFWHSVYRFYRLRLRIDPSPA